MSDFAKFENEIYSFDQDISDLLCDKKQIENNVKSEFTEIDQLLA
jgi:flagellar capping protein FliD